MKLREGIAVKLYADWMFPKLESDQVVLREINFYTSKSCIIYDPSGFGNYRFTSRGGNHFVTTKRTT